jgi:hypothetical protein
MPTLITGLLTTTAFLSAVTGMLFFLAWLERPHRWPRRQTHAPSHRATRSSS